MSRTLGSKDKHKRVIRVLGGATLGSGVGIGTGLVANKYLKSRSVKLLTDTKTLNKYLSSNKGKKEFLSVTGKKYNPSSKSHSANISSFINNLKDPKNIAKHNNKIKLISLGTGGSVGTIGGGIIGNSSIKKEYKKPTKEEVDSSRNKRKIISTLNNTSREARGWINTLRMAKSFI